MYNKEVFLVYLIQALLGALYFYFLNLATLPGKAAETLPGKPL